VAVNSCCDLATLGKTPGVSDVVKMFKNGYSEFKGNNWMKIACGNISSQALSACQEESQCAA
jgi:hypothetical protein